MILKNRMGVHCAEIGLVTRGALENVFKRLRNAVTRMQAEGMIIRNPCD